MKNHRFNYLLLLFIISLVPLLDLFHPGLPLTHDGQDHVARIANFYKNLSEGILIPRWASNLNWGYGHPILMFLYPLPSYMASIFHFLGFSFLDSVKLVFGVTFVVSGLAMYLWLRNYLDEYSGFIGALLYMFAPYRFVDLYVRGAMGEHVFFIFPPLVLYFLYKLSKRNSYWYILGGSLSCAGLILSHNALSLMLLPFIGLYILHLFWKSTEKKTFIFPSVFILLLGFGLASFFWVPAFFEGKYTLRDIVTKNTYSNSFVTFQNLIYGDWNYGGTGQFTVQIGIIHWLVVLSSIVASFIAFKKKARNSVVLIVLLFSFFFTLFIMTSYSSFLWEKISLMQKFQFPWRFLTIIVFVTSVLSAHLVAVIPKKIKLPFIVVLVSFIFLTSKDYWHAQSYLQRDSSFFTSVYDSTTDTGESAPIWSVRFMERRAKASLEVIEGSAVVKQTTRTSTKHEYEITSKKKARIRENTLYFPGWNVFVDGVKASIEFQDPSHRGLMTFFVDNGVHKVSVVFSDTKLRMLGNGISLVSLLFLAVLFILNKYIWQKFR